MDRCMISTAMLIARLSISAPDHGLAQHVYAKTAPTYALGPSPSMQSVFHPDAKCFRADHLHLS